MWPDSTDFLFLAARSVLLALDTYVTGRRISNMSAEGSHPGPTGAGQNTHSAETDVPSAPPERPAPTVPSGGGQAPVTPGGPLPQNISGASNAPPERPHTSRTFSETSTVLGDPARGRRNEPRTPAANRRHRQRAGSASSQRPILTEAADHNAAEGIPDQHHRVRTWRQSITGPGPGGPRAHSRPPRAHQNNGGPPPFAETFGPVTNGSLAIGRPYQVPDVEQGFLYANRPSSSSSPPDHVMEGLPPQPLVMGNINWDDLTWAQKAEILRLPWSSKLALKDHFVCGIGELVGTTMFLFFAFAGTEVANIQASNQGSDTTTGTNNGFNISVLFYISVAFGFSLIVNVWIFFRISGGLFNPAVTFS